MNTTDIHLVDRQWLRIDGRATLAYIHLRNNSAFAGSLYMYKGYHHRKTMLLEVMVPPGGHHSIELGIAVNEPLFAVWSAASSKGSVDTVFASLGYLTYTRVEGVSVPRKPSDDPQKRRYFETGGSPRAPFEYADPYEFYPGKITRTCRAEGVTFNGVDWACDYPAPKKVEKPEDECILCKEKSVYMVPGDQIYGYCRNCIPGMYIAEAYVIEREPDAPTATEASILELLQD